jgi:hypothetical protein
MGCCGRKSGSEVEYEVRTNKGETKRVASVAEARIAIATGGGGTYRAVPKSK